MPSYADVLSLRDRKDTHDYGDYNYYWYTDKSGEAYIYNFYEKRKKTGSTYYARYLKCVSGPIYDSRDELKKAIDENRKKAKDKLLNDFYNKTLHKTNSIEIYEKFLKEYPNTSINHKIEKRLHEHYTPIIEKLKQKNSIKAYEEFLKTNPNFFAPNEVINLIFNLVKKQNNIAGYEWFAKNYPDSPDAKESISKMHALAFEEAKDINTISSYNTFIFNYPLAKEIAQANQKAEKIEKEKYTDIGLLGFIGSDAKLDRKARALLIKAKQIERSPLDNNLDQKSSMGYKIVANRMYDLLQKEFTESEATLRHLESQEFKDFVKDFRRVMKNIQSTLNQTNRYIKDVIQISKKGFEDANADRDMASYYTQKHREWEKFMHFRDRGYN